MLTACPSTDDLIALALGQLPEIEAATLQAHTAACTACHLRMHETMDTVDHIALAVAPVDPPPGLRQQVLVRVATEARNAPGRRAPLAWVVAAALVGGMLGAYLAIRLRGL